MLSVPDIFLSVNFPKFENISCFSCFGKKEENLEKKLFDKNGPKRGIQIKITQNASSSTPLRFLALCDHSS